MVVEPVADLGHRADGGDPAAGHDGDVVGQLFQLVQLVAGDQQTLALLGQLAEQGDELGPADRVDAAERFVEHQQLRVVQQRLGQLDALPHALGVAAQPPVGPAGHADQFQRRLGPPPRFAAAIAAQPGHRLDELPARHFLVKGVHFGAIADVPLGRRCSRRRGRSTSTRPRSGRRWPVISRISVLLPAPLDPTSPVMPGRSSSVTWLTPMTGPYHLRHAVAEQDGRGA